MNKTLLTCLLSFALIPLFAQMTPADSQYEPNDLQPLGSYNPTAPEEVKQFDFLVNMCDCKSVNRNPDGSWQDTLDLVWMAKYTLNGTAIQDYTWREGAFAATSMRQYDTTSNQWAVTYFSFPGVSTQPGTWLGTWNEEEQRMVLSQPQQAPNGMEGNSVLTFFDISDKGFNWEGKWVKDDGSVEWPFWRIYCTGRR